MKEYQVKIVKESEPINICAQNKNEVIDIIKTKLKFDSSENHTNGLIQYKLTEILIKDLNQGWFKDFIENNF